MKSPPENKLWRKDSTPFDLKRSRIQIETMLQKQVQPCRPMCRYRLILVQCRFFRSWLQATVTMLENTLALHAFTLETPNGDYFSPITVHEKIRMFGDELEQNLARISFLIGLTTIGCNFCRQLWSMNVVVSTNFEEPWISFPPATVQTTKLSQINYYLHIYYLCLTNPPKKSPKQTMYAKTFKKLRA